MKKYLLLFVLAFFCNIFAQNLKIHFIDVNQGAATLIEYTNNYYLIDSGKNRSNDKLLNYLRDNEISNLNACVMTHPDTDHIGEFEDLIESEITIERFIKNSQSSSTQTYARLINLLNSQNIPIDIVDYQSNLNWAVNTDILSPNFDWGHSDANSNSIVIKLSFGSFDFLLMADSEEDNNQSLLENYDLAADVIQIGHHGASNATSNTLLNEVNPSIAIIQAGNNSYGHPDRGVVEELENRGIEVYSTALDYNTWWLEPTPVNGSDDLSYDEDIVVVCDGSQIIVNNNVVVSANQNTYAVNNSLNIYPNPFNPSANVSFTTSKPTTYNLSVYNLKGQLVKNIAKGKTKSGKNAFNWNGTNNFGQNCASGIYFFKLKTENKVITKKALLLK